MPDEEVDTGTTADATTDATDGTSGTAAPTIEQLQAQIAQITADSSRKDSLLADERQKAEFWATKANSAASFLGNNGKQPDTADEPTLPDSQTLLASITDPKAFSRLLDDHIKARGLVSEKDVEARITREVNDRTALSSYIAEYPDLQKPKSEMFQAVLANQKTLLENPRIAAVAKVDPIALNVMAAELTITQFKAKAEIEAAKTANESEAQRRTRIARQGGGSGQRHTPNPADTELDDMQRVIASQYGEYITEDQYKAAATKGVNRGFGKGAR